MPPTPRSIERRDRRARLRELRHSQRHRLRRDRRGRRRPRCGSTSSTRRLTRSTLAAPSPRDDHRRRTRPRPWRSDRSAPWTGRTTATAARCSRCASPIPATSRPTPLAGRRARLDPVLRPRAVLVQGGLPVHARLRAAPADARPSPAAAPPIDYLAKDFPSFRRALADFSALRYPDWRERAEADLGVMLLEAALARSPTISATCRTGSPRRRRWRPRRSGARWSGSRGWSTTSRARPRRPRAVLQVRRHRPAPVRRASREAPRPDGGELASRSGDGLVDPTPAAADQPLDARSALEPARPLRRRTRPADLPYLWDDRTAACPPARPAVGRRPRLRLPGRRSAAGHRRARRCSSTPPRPPSADPPVREVVHLAARRGVTDPLSRSR